MEKLIDIQNATVYRGDRKVLDGFSLSVEQGQSTAVLGPNGCGKSTFLKLLSREIYPVVSADSRVRILGQDRPLLTALRRQIALVSQDLQQNFEPGVSALGVVVSGFHGSVGLYHFQEITDDQLQRGRQMLRELGIEQLSNTPFAKMSTGQQRRCLLGRALVYDPAHLILDEPTSGLDIHATCDYLKAIRAMACRGRTLLLATHHIHEIPPEIKRVVFLKDGRIVADGNCEELLRREPLEELFEVRLDVVESGGYIHVYPR